MCPPHPLDAASVDGFGEGLPGVGVLLGALGGVPGLVGDLHPGSVKNREVDILTGAVEVFQHAGKGQRSMCAGDDLLSLSNDGAALLALMEERVYLAAGLL